MIAERKLHEMITEAKANIVPGTDTGSAMFGDACVVVAVSYRVTETIYFVKISGKIESCSRVHVLHVIENELNRIAQTKQQLIDEIAKTI